MTSFPQAIPPYIPRTIGCLFFRWSGRIRLLLTPGDVASWIPVSRFLTSVSALRDLGHHGRLLRLLFIGSRNRVRLVRLRAFGL